VKILLTGASGFIGSALAEELARNGHAVRVLDLQPPPPDLECPVEFVQGDVTDAATCARAVKGCQALCHLAARVGDWGPAEAYFHVNVLGTETLLAAARRAELQRFVLVSSLAVHHYGGHLQGNEQAPRDGHINAYSRSKIAAEDALRLQAGRVEWVIARPGVFPFGPRDRTAFYELARAMERRQLGTVNQGQALLTTAYVDNLAHGLRLTLEHPAAADQVFVLGDDEAISWADLLALFARELQVAPPRLNLPELLAYPLASGMEAAWRMVGAERAPPLTRYRILLSARDCQFSSAKAKELLGYRPGVDLQEAVRRTVAWYRAES